MSEAPTFAMLCCAHGAEQAVKKSIAAQGWRLAFSRPGFVTAKHDLSVPAPQGIFIRASATTIGQTRNQDAESQIGSLVAQLADSPLAGQLFDQLHVWPKDRAPIGRFDFEPGVDEVSQAVAETIYGSISAQWLRCDMANRIAEPDDVILDVVLVEPSHWFIGWHQADTWPSRWPGGVQPIQPKYEPISRAYYKAAEAITWSGFDMKPGDLVVEIGSSPGGACGRLLELGFRVLGIDPASMDPRIAKHPNFHHIRARAGDLPRKEFRDARWMLIDSNVKPEQTLTTVGNIVTHQQTHFRGLLMTLKIGDYDSADKIDGWIESVKAWQPTDIRVRQLARNKKEVCFAVSF